MVLSDRDLKELINKEYWVDPYEPKLIRHSSLKLRLGRQFKIMKESLEVIDPLKTDTTSLFRSVRAAKGFILLPGTFVLASTYEKIGLSRNLSGFLNTESSVARIGLSVHTSAGQVPAGYGEKKGSKITFELYNFGTAPILLYPGMPVAHLTLVRNQTPSERSYENDKSHPGLGAEPINFKKNPQKLYQ